MEVSEKQKISREIIICLLNILTEKLEFYQKKLEMKKEDFTDLVINCIMGFSHSSLVTFFLGANTLTGYEELLHSILEGIREEVKKTVTKNTRSTNFQ